MPKELRFDLGTSRKHEGYCTVNSTGDPDIRKEIIDVDDYIPEDGQVDEFLLSQVLDCIPKECYLEFLFTLRRKLRVGGYLRIIHADASDIIDQHVRGEMSLRAMGAALLSSGNGNRGSVSDRFQVWNADELQNDLEVLGFDVSPFDAGTRSLDASDAGLPGSSADGNRVSIRNIGLVARKFGIPKQVHQTWMNSDIPRGIFPDAWIATWRDMDGFEYKLWTDEDARDLVRERYPWALETYDGYDHAIQRVDAARYFILHRYGGLHVDLDFVRLQPFDALFEANDLILAFESEGIVGNALMGASPNHPLFDEAIRRLGSGSSSQGLRAAGPAFLTSVVADSYHSPEILPSERIYPVGWENPFRHKCRELSVEQLGERFPDSVAVTPWSGSWLHRTGDESTGRSRYSDRARRSERSTSNRPSAYAVPLVFEDIPGWFTRNEAEALYRAVVTARGAILEIGHFLGRSTSCICQAIADSGGDRRFRSYDLGHTDAEEFRAFFESALKRKDFEVPWLYYEWVFESGKTSTDVAREMLERFDLDRYVELVSGDFHEFDHDARFEFIFSDACHEPSEIEVNLDAIVSRSAPRALWAFHDTSDGNVREISRICPRSRYLGNVDGLGFFLLAEQGEH